MKHVLDVGQCPPDHAAIRALIEGHYQAQVTQTHLPGDTLAALRGGSFDLVLVNRKLDADYSDGLDVIRQIKADKQLKHVRCMLITNYPEHQQLAIAAGAELGFGKLEFDLPQTRERLAAILGD
ncbi:MAG: response regulator [Pirellulales bacterium]